jgi:hypothetical protein
MCAVCVLYAVCCILSCELVTAIPAVCVVSIICKLYFLIFLSFPFPRSSFCVPASEGIGLNQRLGERDVYGDGDGDGDTVTACLHKQVTDDR